MRPLAKAVISTLGLASLGEASCLWSTPTFAGGSVNGTAFSNMYELIVDLEDELEYYELNSITTCVDDDLNVQSIQFILGEREGNGPYDL